MPNRDRDKNASASTPELLAFEDYRPGLVWEGGAYTVREDEILEFGRRFDPQPMHVDPVAAKAGPLGGLVAPGSLTFAIRNALYNQLPVRPILVAGLGVERLDLPEPVRPGDVLSIRVVVESCRRSRSKPDRGIVTMKQSVMNDRQAVVMTMVSKMLVRGREGGSPEA